jgi:hypothetical protein
MGSLGTTTTVLHGNAAGAPTFAPIVSADMNITATNCTNQFVSAISTGGVGTCSTVGISQVGGLGTGVATALGVNVGTAGAVVVNGGALGTPSSGVGTNLTGTASGLTAGGVVANGVTRAMEAQGVARSVIGVAGNATANVADIQGTADQVLVVNSAGTALAFGKVNLAGGAGVTGTAAVANGGTGDTGTAWSTFSPSPSCGTAAITTTSGRSKTLGKTMWLEIDFTITAIGSCTASLTFSLPSVTAQSGGGIVGREFGISGKGFTCDVRAASATATCSLADFTNMVVNAHMVASGAIEIQ